MSAADQLGWVAHGSVRAKHLSVVPDPESQLRWVLQSPVAASEYADALQRIPQLRNLGAVFKSAEPLLLTEEETEYSIALVVHIFEAHVLLQFNCSNTVAEQVLENVNVVVDLSEAVRLTRSSPCISNDCNCTEACS